MLRWQALGPGVLSCMLSVSPMACDKLLLHSMQKAVALVYCILCTKEAPLFTNASTYAAACQH